MTTINNRLDQLENAIRPDGLPGGVTAEWIWNFCESGSGHWAFRNQAREEVPCPAGFNPEKIKGWDVPLPEGLHMN